MAEQAVALLYNMEQTQKGRQIKCILIQMGVHIKNIRPEQYSVPLAVLSGVEKPSEEEEIGAFSITEDFSYRELKDEMLVMKGFSSAMLDEFLLRMRKAKIPRTDLKAVLTPSNQEWDSLTLYRELKKEHAAMQAART